MNIYKIRLNEDTISVSTDGNAMLEKYYRIIEFQKKYYHNGNIVELLKNNKIKRIKVI